MRCLRGFRLEISFLMYLTGGVRGIAEAQWKGVRMKNVVIRVRGVA